MPPQADPPDRYLARIRAELDKLPLTGEQKAQAIPKILDTVLFLSTSAGKKVQGQVNDDSRIFDFEPKIRAVAERFAADGLTASDYLQAAVKHPQLFYQSPATTAGHIAGVVERFTAQGLTARNYLQAALKRPSLFSQSPATVAGNIAGMVERFAADGLTARDYLQAALKHPQLFYQSPATTAGHITGMVERFTAQGLTARDYLRAALKRPSLFSQSPATVAGHITGVVERFAAQGLTARAYLQAALKQPQLFAQSSDTIAGHIAGVAERFTAQGLTLDAYLLAALKHPPLFILSPATIARHIDLIFGIYDAGVFTLTHSPSRAARTGRHPHPHAPVLDFLLTNCTLLCLEDKNILLRKLHKEITSAAASPRNLTRPRRETELELMRHLGHDDPARPVPAGANPVLRALIRDGYIKSARLE